MSEPDLVHYTVVVFWENGRERVPVCQHLARLFALIGEPVKLRDIGERANCMECIAMVASQ